MVKIYKLFCLSFLVLLTGSVFAQQNTTLKVIVTSPASLAGTYNAISGGFGATMNKGDVLSGKLVATNDGSANPLYACNALTNAAAVSGNIGLIKRGDCEFGVKCKNAEDAGAKAAVVFNRLTGGPIVMGAGAVGASVTIPVCMISLEDGEKLVAALDAGITVNMTFRIPSFYDSFGPLAFSSPSVQSQPFNPSVHFANTGTTDLTNLVLTADINEPGGTKTTFTQTLASLSPGADSLVTFDLYSPTKQGSYTLNVSNNNDKDTLSTSFEVSKAKFAIDNVQNDVNVNQAQGWITLATADFVSSGGRYDMGVTYAAGPNGGKVAYAAFALNNLDSFPVGTTFDILLIKTADAGQTTNGSATSYDDFTTVGLSQYTKTAGDVGQNLLFVKLEDLGGSGAPIDLEPDASYLIVVKYEDSNNSTNPPKFVYNSQLQYNFSNETVWTDRLYMGGWSGEYNIVLRMYTNEFIVGVKDLPSYEEHQLVINPNPADSYINVGFDFNEVTAEVKTAVVDVNGKVVRTKKYTDVQKNSYVEDVTDLAPGTYFYSVITKNGWAVKPFIVISNASK